MDDSGTRSASGRGRLVGTEAKRRLVALGAGVALSMALVLGLEGALRLIGHRAGYSRFDPQTQWSLRPGYSGPGPDLPGVPLTYELRVNADGFRGGPLQRTKPADVVRLVALGDSVSFGFGVPEDEVFIARVAALVAPALAPRRVEWINAGVPGFTSVQGMRDLERRVLGLEPDVVTVLYGWNDGWRTAVPDTSRRPPSRAVALIERSRLLTLARWGANLLARQAGLVRRDPRGLLPRVPVEEFEATLLEIVERIRGAGALPVLVTPPAAFGPERPPEAYFRYEWTVPRAELEPTRRRYADAIRRAAARAAVPLVDCASQVPADPTLFLADGYHPNAAGYRLMAEQIAAVLRQVRLPQR